MATLKYQGIGINAMAACVPSFVYDNRNLTSIMPEQEAEKLIKSIGIEQRRLAADGVTASDLCLKAAEQLIEENNIEKGSIDMLLFLSLCPDYVTPPTSIVLQQRLGLPTTCGCMDLCLACSGFIYALSTAYAYLSNPNIHRVMLCVGETMSKLANPRDKVNFPLYGDAGTATLVEKGDFGETTFLLSSDGAGERSVIVPARGFRNPLTVDSLADKEYENGNFRRLIDITMDGMDTFNHAIRIIPKEVKETMHICGITNDDIDYYVSHQANKLMVDFIVKRLKIDPAKVPFCLPKYGNTSCASVPLTFVSELEGKINENKRILMSSIGAGWSYATAYLSANKIHISHLIEY